MRLHAQGTGRVGMELPPNNSALEACCTMKTLMHATGHKAYKDAKSTPCARTIQTGRFHWASLATDIGLVRAVIQGCRGARPCWSLTSNERDAWLRPPRTVMCHPPHPHQRTTRTAAAATATTSSSTEAAVGSSRGREGRRSGQKTGADFRTRKDQGRAAAGAAGGQLADLVTEVRSEVAADLCHQTSSFRTERFHSTSTDSFFQKHCVEHQTG